MNGGSGVRSTVLRPGQKILVAMLAFIGGSWAVQHVLVPVFASLWPWMLGLGLAVLVVGCFRLYFRYRRRQL